MSRATGDFDNKTLATAFFGNLKDIAAKAKVACKCCQREISKPSSGFTAFISHVDAHHSDVKKATYDSFLKIAAKTIGPMNKFVLLHTTPISYKVPLASADKTAFDSM